jgi:hypothetical protein
VNKEKIAAALDTEFESMDIGRVTARGYLKALLEELLLKGESFSGKRPWGNSGWEHELAMPLCKAGVIEATIDDERYAYPVVEAL